MTNAQTMQVSGRRAPTILMYSPDSIGLGHMRRNSAIAEGLTQELPGVSNLLLVGSSAGVYFDLPAGSDCVKLPAILKTGRNEWSPKSLHVPNEVARDIRSRIITETALALRPDVFLVDHLPNGIWDELLPALRALKNLPRRPRLVLGLRDILGAPQEIRSQWSAAGIYNIIDEFYDRILIYGSPGLYPTGDHYGLTGRFGDRITYCGLVHHASPAPAPRNAKPFKERPMVLMTAGGGHDAFPMMNFVINALREHRASLDFDLRVVTGPLMPAAYRLKIAAMARELNAQCIDSTPRLHALLGEADAVITMGGYNTVMEAIASGVPAVVIPRTGPSAEQRCRASLFAELGLVRSVDIEYDNPGTLVEALRASLAAPRRTTPPLKFEGIRNAARCLADMAIAGNFAQHNKSRLEAVA